MQLLQRNSNKVEPVSLSCKTKFPLIEPFSEKYLKKLIGKTDIEDALKRLDRLTQEEARMAAAQLLRVTNTIDNRVRGIADNMLVVDNRVAGIDDRVAGVDERVATVDERVASVDERVVSVDERVASVDDRVKDVDDKVKAVDDKLMAVFDGAQYIFSQLSKIVQLLSRWKRGKRSYPENGRRRGPSETFVISEPHSCTYRLNHPHRESSTTGSPQMAVATRSIYESQYRVERPSQRNGDLVF